MRISSIIVNWRSNEGANRLFQTIFPMKASEVISFNFWWQEVWIEESHLASGKILFVLEVFKKVGRSSKGTEGIWMKVAFVNTWGYPNTELITSGRPIAIPAKTRFWCFFSAASFWRILEPVTLKKIFFIYGILEGFQG